MARLDQEEFKSLEDRINCLAEEAAAGLGMEIVLVEIKGGAGRSLVRVFIDQRGGVTIDDCERFSKRLSVLLDVEDFIPFSYILEVSSPGLERPLVSEKDFERYTGKTARVRTRLPVEGQRNFKGTLRGAGDGRVSLELAPGKVIEIVIKEIEKANLTLEI